MAVALLLLGAVLGEAWAAYCRDGRFPARAADVALLCCTPARTLAGLSPVEQLRSAPLAAFPLLDEGLRAAKAGDPPRARALMTQAVRRFPQLAEARFWLVQDAVAHHQYFEAIKHLDWLYAIYPQSRAKLIEALGGITTLPGGLSSMRAYVQRNPEWRKPLVEQLVSSGASPALSYALVSPDNDLSTSGGGALINGMLVRKDYERAYLAWLAQLPAANLVDVGNLYDSNLRGLPGALPFNWNLSDSDGVTTNLIKGGGAHISYFGDVVTRTLEQMTVLARGSYTLDVTTSTRSPADANQIAATIACVTPGATPLVTLRLPPSSHPTQSRAHFTVPGGCEAQLIAFVGTPAEFTKAADFDVVSVTITKDPS